MSPSRRPALGRPVLVLRGVSKTYRAGVPGCVAIARVLRGVDLVVRAGERVAVVGAPGSGKTTLLLVAAGALRIDAGDVRSIGAARSARPARDAAGETLSWRDADGAMLLATRSLSTRHATFHRVLRLEHGALHLVAWSRWRTPARVASPSGPP